MSKQAPAMRVVTLLFAGIASAYVAIVGLSWWLQSSAHQAGAQAMQEFRGDEIEALLALVESGRHSLRDRNHAVHALAQLGDRRALPVLEQYYTGQPCNHARGLCQRELGKAIARCRSENWAPRWLPLFPRAPV